MTLHADRYRDEVVGLHAFFEAWFRGTLTNDDDAFARCADALAPDFEIVPPSGERVSRADLLETLREAHGGRSPHFTIEVRHVRVRPLTADAWLVTYEEWQRDTDGAPWSTRTSTAVLEQHADAPYGIRWRHVHETRIDDADD